MSARTGWWHSLRQAPSGGLPFLGPWIALSLLVPPLTAQTETALTRGARVRVVLPGELDSPQRFVRGSLVRLGSDSVVIMIGPTAKDTAVYRVGLDSRMRLERMVGSKGHTWVGVLAGGLVGGMVGGFIGDVVEGECTDGWCFFEDLGKAIGAGFGAVTGGVIGGIIGHSIRSEEWAPVGTAGVRIAFAPRAVGVRIDF